MSVDTEASGVPAESIRRVFAMALVISCHLGLLVLLLRPAAPIRGTALVAHNDPLALKLRFILQLRSIAHPVALPAPGPVASTLRIFDNTSGTARMPQPAQRATKAVALASEASAVSSPTVHAAPISLPTPGSYAEEASTNDGGFRQRLINAQRSHAVDGVPGSDRRLVPGIELTKPMDQGIGAVMRKAQRLFGITNSHCIDVDVWRQLTPEELSARHISTSDVNKLSDEYRCDSPKGLSF